MEYVTINDLYTNLGELGLYNERDELLKFKIDNNLTLKTLIIEEYNQDVIDTYICSFPDYYQEKFKKDNLKMFVLISDIPNNILDNYIKSKINIKKKIYYAMFN
jgi:hypothetical protein